MRMKIGKIRSGPNYKDLERQAKGRFWETFFFFQKCWKLSGCLASCKLEIYVADYSSAKDFDSI